MVYLVQDLEQICRQDVVKWTGHWLPASRQDCRWHRCHCSPELYLIAGPGLAGWGLDLQHHLKEPDYLLWGGEPERVAWHLGRNNKAADWSL